MARYCWAVAAGALAVAAAGCGGGTRFAPVSGIVMLDDKPYPNAVITFQPIGTKENPNPGRGSSAYTDESGRFVLKGPDGQDGAVVGKHQVRIMTRGNDVVGQDPNSASPDGATGRRGVDPIPPEWNAQSDKEFDVPAGGTDQARFEITSRGKRK